MLEIQSSPSKQWELIVTKSRVDSFNQKQLTDKIDEVVRAGSLLVAIDLKATRFLSLAALKFIVDMAKVLKEKGGQLALVAPSEKTKRHFEIYGSLDHIEIFRSGLEASQVRRHEIS